MLCLLGDNAEQMRELAERLIGLNDFKKSASGSPGNTRVKKPTHFKYEGMMLI